jgi:hypothetical protein
MMVRRSNMSACNAPNRTCAVRDGDRCPPGACWYQYSRLRDIQLREFREREIARAAKGQVSIAYFGDYNPAGGSGNHGKPEIDS